MQRVLKTVKYLREFGWEPIVFTAANAAYPVLDESLASDIPDGVEVIQGSIWEPYELYKRFTSQKKDARVYSGFMDGKKKPSFTQRASVWIRGNFFIPDARKFWIKPSVNLLTEWLENNHVDAILSSGPPHTAHIIARDLKRIKGIPWLADFRDPWTNIDFYDQLMLTKWADRLHRSMEQTVLREADAVTTVSWGCAEDFIPLGRDNVHVIFNGFDADNFKEVSDAGKDKTFSICHIGSVNKDRNHPAVWEAIAELANSIPSFRDHLRLRFIGKTEETVFAHLRELGLEDNTERVDYLPHSEVGKELARAQVLLLLINDTPSVKGIVTGKMFEYMAAKRPILAIGAPGADADRVLKKTKAGVLCGFRDKEHIKITLSGIFAAYEAGNSIYVGDTEEINSFTRRGGTATFADILEEIT